MNLSKMAGLTINESLEDKVAPIKSTTNKLTSPCVLPFRSCFAGSLQFPSSTVKQTKLFYYNFGDFSHFYYEENSGGYSTNGEAQPQGPTS